MGSYQSHEFIEPVAYGFETEQLPSAAFVVIQPPIRVKTGACTRCIKRTRTKIAIEDRSRRRYDTVCVALVRCVKQLEVTSQEIPKTAEKVAYISEKIAEYTVTKDKAPKYLRVQHAEAHSKQRAVLERHAHLTARLARKEKAVINLENLWKSSQNYTVDAMNRQIDCAKRRSIRAPC